MPFEPLFRAPAAGDDALLLDSGHLVPPGRPRPGPPARVDRRGPRTGRPGRPMRLSRYHVGSGTTLPNSVSPPSTAPPDREHRAAATSPSPSQPGSRGPAGRPCGPYQVDGYRWLASIWDASLGGASSPMTWAWKTLQTIALLRKSQGHRENSTILCWSSPRPACSSGRWARSSPRAARVTVLAETAKRRVRQSRTRRAWRVPGGHRPTPSSSSTGTTSPRQAGADLVLDEGAIRQEPPAKTHHMLPHDRRAVHPGDDRHPAKRTRADGPVVAARSSPGLYPRADRFSRLLSPDPESGESPDAPPAAPRIKPLMLRRTRIWWPPTCPEAGAAARRPN